MTAKPASLLDYIRCFDIDERHIWHPYTQAKISDSPLMVEKAEAEFLYVKDKYGNEKKIIDGVSSWWVNIHGHSHPYINQRIKEQLDKYEHVIFANFTHKAATDFIAKLIPMLPQPILNSQQTLHKLSRAFFSDNGSTAVEVALKMSVQYFYNQGHYNKNRIMAFTDGYHGDTVGAMSASGTPQFQQAFKSLTLPVDFVRSPSPEITESYKDASEKTLNEIRKLLSLHPNKYAAIIIEPMIQGAGGMKFHSQEFLRELRLITDRNEILLIADEVFVGFGRTGRNFACEHAGIVPDIICLSKGITGGYLPMGLTVTTDEVYSAFYDDAKSKTFFHGHSYTANPLACAAALASLELYESENRLNDVALINRNMSTILDTEELRSLDHVKDIRIMGAVAVVELKAQDAYMSELSQNLQREFLKRHIYLRPLGNVLYFMPPYTISQKSLIYVLENIREVIMSL